MVPTFKAESLGMPLKPGFFLPPVSSSTNHWLSSFSLPQASTTTHCLVLVQGQRGQVITNWDSQPKYIFPSYYLVFLRCRIINNKADPTAGIETLSPSLEKSLLQTGFHPFPRVFSLSVSLWNILKLILYTSFNLYYLVVISNSYTLLLNLCLFQEATMFGMNL